VTQLEAFEEPEGIFGDPRRVLFEIYKHLEVGLLTTAENIAGPQANLCHMTLIMWHVRRHESNEKDNKKLIYMSFEVMFEKDTVIRLLTDGCTNQVRFTRQLLDA